MKSLWRAFQSRFFCSASAWRGSDRPCAVLLRGFRGGSIGLGGIESGAAGVNVRGRLNVFQLSEHLAFFDVIAFLHVEGVIVPWRWRRR